MALWILSGTTQASWYQKKHSPIEHTSRYTNYTESAVHGPFYVRPTVTFPVAKHCHRLLADTHFLPYEGWRLSEVQVAYQDSIYANGHPSHY